MLINILVINPHMKVCRDTCIKISIEIYLTKGLSRLLATSEGGSPEASSFTLNSASFRSLDSLIIIRSHDMRREGRMLMRREELGPVVKGLQLVAAPLHLLRHIHLQLAAHCFHLHNKLKFKQSDIHSEWIKTRSCSKAFNRI